MGGASSTVEQREIPYSEIDKILDNYNRDPSAMIAILQDIQELMDYVPKESLFYLGEKLNISPAKIYGIVTFYAQFRLEPKGKYIIMLCEGTACHVNGAKLIRNTIADELNIKGGETTPDGLFTLEPVACIGCCSLSPVMVINDETHALLTPEATRKIIKSYIDREKEEAAQN